MTSIKPPPGFEEAMEGLRQYELQQKRKHSRQQTFSNVAGMIGLLSMTLSLVPLHNDDVAAAVIMAVVGVLFVILALWSDPS